MTRKGLKHLLLKTKIRYGNNIDNTIVQFEDLVRLQRIFS